ncbi:MAG: hypothetical protein ACP5KW_11245 [Thermoproteota archaeon]
MLSKEEVLTLRECLEAMLFVLVFPAFVIIGVLIVIVGKILDLCTSVVKLIRRR